jgi:hypothetical protein
LPTGFKNSFVDTKFKTEKKPVETGLDLFFYDFFDGSAAARLNLQEINSPGK